MLLVIHATAIPLVNHPPISHRVTARMRPRPHARRGRSPRQLPSARGSQRMPLPARILPLSAGILGPSPSPPPAGPWPRRRRLLRLPYLLAQRLPRSAPLPGQILAGQRNDWREDSVRRRPVGEGQGEGTVGRTGTITLYTYPSLQV